MKLLSNVVTLLSHVPRTIAFLGLILLASSAAALPALADAVQVLSADFDADADSFVYSDDLFNGTSEPAYASGNRDASAGYTGGALVTQLGGIDGADIDGISGGWNRDFTLPATSEVTLAFRYRLWAAPDFESNECQQVVASLDGTIIPVDGNDYVHEICGGGDTGWQQATIDLGMLPEGAHTLALGGFINLKTSPPEEAQIFFDDVAVSVPQSVFATDVAATVGEDDGAQSFAYDAIELNGSPLTYALTSLPAEGTASDNGDGTFTFDPGTDFQDLDEGETRVVSFGYETSNGTDAAAATITVTVAGSGVGGDLDLPGGSVGPSDTVGTIAGKIGVTPSGSVSYAIPIAVPPGTFGVEPAIALRYSSGGGNGIAGLGWSINGLSAIARCPTTRLHDGFVDPVDFDDNDKFCLNGERLVPVFGAYGADGTEYRTSFEEFSKVVSYGTAGSGPERFKVWRKSGEIVEYGFTEDARVEAAGRTDVRVWAVNRIDDRAGNYVAFSYFEDDVTGEHRIDRIDYTGNDGQGLLPYNAISFLYEDRPDPTVSYVGGSPVTRNMRLAGVEVYADEALFRTYALTYRATGEVSQLVSIEECAGDGACLPATAFEWAAPGIDAAEIGLTNVSLGPDQGITGMGSSGYSSDFHKYRVGASGDFNGDGLTDLYLHKADDRGRMDDDDPDDRNDYVFLGNRDHGFDQVALGESSGITTQFAGYDGRFVAATGDFNGDGLTDAYLHRADWTGLRSYKNTSDYVWLSNGDGTFTTLNANAAGDSATYGPPEEFRVGASGDFNGDGLTDLYFFKADNRGGRSTGHSADRVWLSNGDGSFTATIFDSSEGISGSAYTKFIPASVGDFNGDGLTDIYWYKAREFDLRTASGNAYHAIWFSQGDGTFDEVFLGTEDGVPSAFDYYKVATAADFNGDGLTDLLFYKSDEFGRTKGGADAYLWINQGNAAFETVTIVGGFPDDRFIYPGDFNGDGLTDLYALKVDDDGQSTGTTTDHLWINTNGRAFAKITLDGNQGIADASYDYHADSGFHGHLVAAAGDFDGDGADDLYLHDTVHDDFRASGQDDDYIFFGRGRDPGLLTAVEDGLSVRTEVDYAAMTDPAVYAKGTGAAYPEYNVIGSRQVVAEVRTDDGIGGQNAQTYAYADFRYHVATFGSLGFARVAVTDEDTGIVSEAEYSHDHANGLQGLMTAKRSIAPDATVLSETLLTWAVDDFPTTDGTPLQFRHSPNRTETTRDLNGDLIATVVTDTIYNATGSPTQVAVTTTGDGSTYTEVADNVYGADNLADWLIGRPTETTVTHSATGVLDIVRTAAFTYDADGFLASETVEPGDPLEHTKTYTRNGFGAITAVTETWGSTASDGIAATSRTSSFAFDARSRYPVSETNPLAHVETSTYDPLLGTLASTTGPNGLTTQFAVDGFGRPEAELRADSTTTRIFRYFCDGDPPCPAGAATVEVTETDGAPTETAYFDALGREVRNAVTALDGRDSLVDTVYDHLGRVIQKSEPYFAGEPVYWTLAEYDILDRPVMETNPDASVKSYAYYGRSVVVTNELVQVQITEKDALGRESVVTDDSNNVATYDYDAAGNLIAMTDQAGNVTAMAYDIRGNKIAMVDPDKGAWSYRYNALGLLVEQTDALSQTTTIAYDLLGRMIERVDDAYGLNPEERTAVWEYDTAVMGFGKLARAANSGYERLPAYDSLGRPASTTETIDGTQYTLTTTYDAFSRAEDLVFPSGLTARNVYSASGHLASVIRPTTGAPYWEALSQDARGNVTFFRLGNGVESTRVHDPETGRLTAAYAEHDFTVVQDLAFVFDPLGNLVERADSRQGLYETFLYDNLNRVIQVETLTGGEPETTLLIQPVSMWTGGGTTTVVDIAYDAIGNMVSKTDVGAYLYGEDHGECLTGAAGPHAVSSVTGTKNAVYCYDANGDMLSGDGRTYVWSAFGKPVTITKGSNQVDLAYGPDRARFKRIDTTATDQTVTHYVGGKLYEAIDRGGVAEQKHYLGGFAVVTHYVATGVMDHAYYLTDHLGSIDTVTDQSGAVIERMSFDAWGKRRQTDWVPIPDPAGYLSLTTTRGYTGHEQLDPVGLIHMNGRVYDPEIGRFVSADPIIQFPFNLQNLNRYSYVLNNPLSFTDPTGLALFNNDGSFAETVGGTGSAQRSSSSYSSGSPTTGSSYVASNPYGIGSVGSTGSSSGSSNTAGYSSGYQYNDIPSWSVIASSSGGDTWLPDASWASAASTSGGSWLYDPAPLSSMNSLSGGLCSFCYGGSVVGTHYVGAPNYWAAGPFPAADTGTYWGNSLLNSFASTGNALTNPFVAAVATIEPVSDHLLMIEAAAAAYPPGRPLGAVAGGLATASRAAATVRGGLAPVRLGQAGEAAVRAAFDIGPKTRVNFGGRNLEPDGLNRSVITEVKNVTSLSYTRQLRDYAAYARQNGLRFDLFVVRSNSRLSGPLLTAADNGWVNLRRDVLKP